MGTIKVEWGKETINVPFERSKNLISVEVGEGKD